MAAAARSSAARRFQTLALTRPPSGAATNPRAQRSAFPALMSFHPLGVVLAQAGGIGQSPLSMVHSNKNFVRQPDTSQACLQPCLSAPIGSKCPTTGYCTTLSQASGRQITVELLMNL